MKVIRLLIIHLVLIFHIHSVSFTPIAPTDTSPVFLDALTGSSSPMTTKLSNGNFLTIFQVTSLGKSRIFYSRSTTATPTQIILNTYQAQPRVINFGGSDAVVLYEEFVSSSTNVVINIFTLSVPIVLTVGSFSGATFTELYPNFARSGNNIAVCWSETTNIHGRIYAIANNNLTPSAAITIGVTCSANCFGVLINTANGNFALTYKLVASPYTTGVAFLTSALVIDTSVNSGNVISLTNAPTAGGLPAACGRNDGTEIAIASINNTNLEVYIYNTSTGGLVGTGPCIFNVTPSNPYISETATAGLYAISYTSNNKVFVLFVNNTCSVSILTNGTNTIQVDSTAGINQDNSSVAAVPGSTSSAFFISYVETNTTTGSVRIRGRVYAMNSDCTSINIFMPSIVTDPLSLANVTAANVYIVTLPIGTLKSGNNAITLNTQLTRNTINYVGSSSTDSFTFKISYYDTPCQATINACASSCATCSNVQTSTNMNCSTCITNNYFIQGTHNCYSSQTVPPGYYLSTNVYKICFTNCKTCTSGGTSDTDQRCLSCANGYFPVIDDSSTCFKDTDTPNKLYYDKTNTTFNHCFQSCLTCATAGTADKNNCLTCDPTNYASKNDDSTNCFAIDQPQVGYMYDKNSNMFIKCYSSCATCSATGTEATHNCLTCLDNYYNAVNLPNNCYAKSSQLPSYYFNSNEFYFKQCYKSCVSCTDGGDYTNQNCTSCSQDYYPNVKETTKCYQSDENILGFYFDQTLKSFQYCYKTCISCNAAGTFFNPNCTACKDGQVCQPCLGLNYNETCLSTCPKNTYLDDTGKTCYDCTESNPRCCSTFFYQSKCYENCPEGTGPDQTGKGCQLCSDSDRKLYYQGSCVDECPRGSVEVNKICKKCAENDKDKLFYNNSCVSVCPSESIPKNGICEPLFNITCILLFFIIDLTCPNGYCSNGGTCQIVVNYPTCVCLNGFTGLYCQISSTDTETISNLKSIYSLKVDRSN
jgi:hypothetical protein